MTSNEILRREAHVLAEEIIIIISKLKAFAKDFKHTPDAATDHKVCNVRSAMEMNGECS